MAFDFYGLRSGVRHAGNPPNQWRGIIRSHDARPAGTAGASVTPAQNAYGAAWADVLSTPTAFDTFEMEVEVHNIFVSGQATDSLTKIGVDVNGSTNYVDKISHLLTSYAGGFGNALGNGLKFRFPFYIPRGSTIGAKGSINNGTVGTQRVSVTLYGRPTREDQVWAATECVTFGEVTASSRGTAVTAGTASEGSYTQLGSVIATSPLLWWMFGIAPSSNAAQNNGQVTADLALGAAQLEVISNQLIASDTTEANYGLITGRGGRGEVGDGVFVRAQSATATTAFSAIAYGFR